MDTFCETRSYWQGGFTEDEQNIIRNTTCLKKGNTYGHK